MTYKLSLLNKNILKITGIAPKEGDENYEEDFLAFLIGITINVIKYKASDLENPKILDYMIAHHTEDGCESLYTITKDGHYIIDSVMIFTLEKAKEFGVSTLCSDGINIYWIDNGDESTLTPVSVEDLLSEDYLDYCAKNTQETFAICYLYNCYLRLCDEKFKNLMKNRCVKKENVDCFDLDLIGLSISAIKYNLEFGYMTTAQTIIEDIYKCVNICNNNERNCGCGC